MRKIQKILTGTFLAGVLLGGIGTGIAMVEYTSMEYGGEKMIGEECLVTRNFDFDFDLDGRKVKVLNTSSYMGKGGVREIEVDDTVPIGTVRYEVTYNEELVTPYLEFEKEEEELDSLEPERQTPEEEAALGYLWLTAWYRNSDFKLLMENKNYVLDELKQKKISNYEVAYITDVKIKINSQTVPYIETSYIIQQK